MKKVKDITRFNYWFTYCRAMSGKNDGLILSTNWIRIMKKELRMNVTPFWNNTVLFWYSLISAQSIWLKLAILSDIFGGAAVNRLSCSRRTFAFSQFTRCQWHRSGNKSQKDNFFHSVFLNFGKPNKSWIGMQVLPILFFWWVKKPWVWVVFRRRKDVASDKKLLFEIF